MVLLARKGWSWGYLLVVPGASLWVLAAWERYGHRGREIMAITGIPILTIGIILLKFCAPGSLGILLTITGALFLGGEAPDIARIILGLLDAFT